MGTNVKNACVDTLNLQILFGVPFKLGDIKETEKI